MGYVSPLNAGGEHHARKDHKEDDGRQGNQENHEKDGPQEVAALRRSSNKACTFTGAGLFV